jgi:hypothetical protein
MDAASDAVAGRVIQLPTKFSLATGLAIVRSQRLVVGLTVRGRAGEYEHSRIC